MVMGAYTKGPALCHTSGHCHNHGGGRAGSGGILQDDKVNFPLAYLGGGSG